MSETANPCVVCYAELQCQDPSFCPEYGPAFIAAWQAAQARRAAMTPAERTVYEEEQLRLLRSVSSPHSVDVRLGSTFVQQIEEEREKWWIP